MTPLEILLRNDAPARHAKRTYDRAVRSHFDLAQRLLVQGKPDEAEKVAKGAALLRWFAVSEVVV